MAPPILTIGIAGGSGAGKTRLSKLLYQELGAEVNVCYLVHDSYYRSQPDKSFEERAKTNFDHPDSLETDLLIEHVRMLKSNKAVEIPTYDFATHARVDQTTTVQPKKIILVEGILLFCHPELVAELDIKVFVDADADIRLVRRISRDCKERGRTVDDVCEQYQKTVRPMHAEWVEPSKRLADLIVHSHGDSMKVAINIITNHLKISAGITDELLLK